MKTKTIITMLIICLVLGVTASQIASSYPDGLEWVAEQFNFLDIGEGKEVIDAPMPDYAIPIVKNPFLSSALAAILGTIIVFIVVVLLGKIFKRRS